MANIIDLIKKIAYDVVENSVTSDFCYGYILSLSPLKIQINEKIILNSNNMVIVKNALYNAKKGNKVILGKFKGGQKYVVIGLMEGGA